MLNLQISLQKPGIFGMKYNSNSEELVCVRPTFMSICHADQRYYRGLRSGEILKKKLPMVLIHECCGVVYKDVTDTFKTGQKVVLIPNVKNENIKDSQIYENYQKGSKFRSSNIDGFMQELIFINHDRVVPFFFEEHIASMTELISVCVHAVDRFLKISHICRNKIGIWGDGNVAFLLSLVLGNMLPLSQIFIIGRHEAKLSLFTFVNKTFLEHEIPSDFEIDHAFESTGGQEGCSSAISNIIKYINPQGSVVLMGVSEGEIPINTRCILEKGLTFIGSSRSGFDNFKKSIDLLSNLNFRERIKNIIYQTLNINNILDIHEAFESDFQTPFKTVLKWNI